MITIIFYLVWRFMLDKDDELAMIGILTSVLDGLVIYGFTASLLGI